MRFFKYFTTVPLDKRKKDNRIFAITLITILVILTIFIDPRSISLLSCEFKNMTGHNCMTCGMSRSFYAFAQLDIRSAFGYHLFGPLLYLFFLTTLVKFSIELWNKKEYKLLVSPLIRKRVFIILLSLWVCYWMIVFN